MYHIYLIIADAADGLLDSGIFMEANSFTSGITDLSMSDNSTVSIHPNSVNENTYMNIVLPCSKTVSYTVFNSLGQQVDPEEKLGMLNEGKHTFKLDVEKFQTGVYFIQIKLDDRVHVKKMVVK